MSASQLTISTADSAAALWALPAACLQLVVTSPPYDELRAYGGHQWNFEGTAQGIHRALCDGGVLCWVVNDGTEPDGSESLTSCLQKIFFRRDCGMVVHDTMIYQKLNFSNPEKVRYHQVFEYVFIFSKGKPRCFNPISDRRNLSAGKPGCYGVNTISKRDGSKGSRRRSSIKEFGMRHNVWLGKTAGQETMCRRQKHPAPMPAWLTRDLILSWSNPGDWVADPMAGKGTTGVEALKLGRHAWLNDINPAYTRLCKKNCRVTPGLA